ncbi:hypothetical protein [Streptomyces platensis]
MAGAATEPKGAASPGRLQTGRSLLDAARRSVIDRSATLSTATLR